MSGLGNNFNASSHSDLEDDTEEEEEVTEKDVRSLKKVSLIRNHRFNSQAIEETVSHHEQDVEEGTYIRAKAEAVSEYWSI